MTNTRGGKTLPSLKEGKVEKLIERLRVIALDKYTPVPASEALHDAADELERVAIAALRTPEPQSDDDLLGDGSDYGITGEWWGRDTSSLKDDAAAICERLLTVESCSDELSNNVCTNSYRNPDGPEAVAFIAAQQQQIEKLERALKEAEDAIIDKSYFAALRAIRDALPTHGGAA